MPVNDQHLFSHSRSTRPHVTASEAVRRLQYRKVHAAVRLLDPTVREMLQLYTYIQAIGKHIARAQVIAELERRRQLFGVVVVQRREQVNTDAGFAIETLFIIALEAEDWCETDVGEVLAAIGIVVTLFMPLSDGQVPVAADVGAIGLPPGCILPVPLRAQTQHLDLGAGAAFHRDGVNGVAGSLQANQSNGGNGEFEGKFFHRHGIFARVNIVEYRKGTNCVEKAGNLRLHKNYFLITTRKESRSHNKRDRDCRRNCTALQANE